MSTTPAALTLPLQPCSAHVAVSHCPEHVLDAPCCRSLFHCPVWPALWGNRYRLLVADTSIAFPAFKWQSALLSGPRSCAAKAGYGHCHQQRFTSRPGSSPAADKDAAGKRVACCKGGSPLRFACCLASGDWPFLLSHSPNGAFHLLVLARPLVPQFGQMESADGYGVRWVPEPAFTSPCDGGQLPLRPAASAQLSRLAAVLAGLGGLGGLAGALAGDVAGCSRGRGGGG